jgi:hypothetical protein
MSKERGLNTGRQELLSKRRADENFSLQQFDFSKAFVRYFNQKNTLDKINVIHNMKPLTLYLFNFGEKSRILN